MSPQGQIAGVTKMKGRCTLKDDVSVRSGPRGHRQASPAQSPDTNRSQNDIFRTIGTLLQRGTLLA